MKFHVNHYYGCVHVNNMMFVVNIVGNFDKMNLMVGGQSVLMRKFYFWSVHRVIVFSLDLLQKNRLILPNTTSDNLSLSLLFAGSQT